MGRATLVDSRKEFSLRAAEFIVLSALNFLCFFVVYGFTNHRALPPELYHHWYFDWELSMPFVPSMILVYFSLNILTGLSVFLLSRKQLRAFAWSCLLCTIGAGAFFYFFPTQCGFVRPTLESLGIWMPIFGALYGFDQPHNLVPSLHVAYSGLAVCCIARTLPGWKWALSVWLFSLCLSVLFTHQHHILDIGSGLLLSYSLYKYVYCRLAK